MNFGKALEALKEGKKIRLASWEGFWQLEAGRIMMHCKDGRIIDLQDTEDIIYTLSNIASDEWEILDDNYRIEDIATTMRFGEAIRNLKAGKKVTRKGWNGKGMFLFLANGEDIQSCIGVEEKCVDVICMKTAQNTIVFGWLASQTDMLSEDWVIVE